MRDTIEVENVNHPGHRARVNRLKYTAIRALMLAHMPSEGPGLTAAQIKDALRPYLPQDLFPGGKALGWWAKTVQLDLEAKGLMARTETKPLRFHLVP